MHIHMMVMMMMENMMIIIADNKHSNNNTFGFTIRAVTKTNDERRGRGEGSSDEIWLSASWLMSTYSIFFLVNYIVNVSFGIFLSGLFKFRSTVLSVSGSSFNAMFRNNH